MADQSGFLAVAERLKLALEADSDLRLAELLGLSQSAWSNRKTRGSLPRQQIDELIAREQLNPEFIYEGKGAVHIALDGEPWKAGLLRRLSNLFSYETYVATFVHNGYKAKDLQAVSAGKAEVSAELLRDLRLYLKVDLNALLCDEPPITADESLLLTRYRRSSPDGRRVVDALVAYTDGKAA